MRIRALIPLLAAVASFAALPAAAQAADPACGDTVTHNVKLHANLDCSGGGTNGLIVGKNGVTIDLNSHSITGAGGADGYHGIDDDSYDKVTVKNGTIKDFEYPLYVYYGSQSNFSKLKLVDGTQDYYGAYLYYTGNDTVDHVTAVGADADFYLEYNGSLTVNKSTAKDYDTYGFYIYEDGADRFTNDVASGDPAASASSYGFYDEEGSGNTYVKSKAFHSYVGFDLYEPTRIHVSHATANHNDDVGVYFEDDAITDGYIGNSVKNSTANDNAYGFYSSEVGVSGAHNKAFDNTYGCYYIACN